MLSLLQCSSMVNLTEILTSLIASQRTSSSQHDQLRRIQSLLYEFDRLQITAMEYAYLKLISIFNPYHDQGRNSMTERRSCRLLLLF